MVRANSDGAREFDAAKIWLLHPQAVVNDREVSEQT
jgi:hypothetical protein